MNRKLVFAAAGLCLAAAAVTALAAANGLFNSGKRPDENGMYTAQGHWVEALGEADTESAARFAEKLKKLKADLLTGDNRTFYAIVPDKGYYLPGEVTPATDYAALFAAADEGLADSGIEKIDLTGALTLEDYYFTDSHWRQERLGGVVAALGEAMGFSADMNSFDPVTVEGFIGAYGKYGADVPEELTYMVSDATVAAVCDNYQYPDSTAVYDLARLDTDVPYDVFLSGASPLITVESPLAATDKELVVFRDSYASSLVPLLLGQYRKVTLVDIRYMVSGLVPQYVEFTNQDVLFLYSTYVVNQSAMLR